MPEEKVEEKNKGGVLDVLLGDRDKAKEAIRQLNKQLEDSDLEHAKKLKKIKDLETKIKELTEGKRVEEPTPPPEEETENKDLFDSEL